MQRFIPLFILVLIFSLSNTPASTQVITCTGSKVHIAGATTVQGMLISDTATRIESAGLLKATVLKNSGIVDLNSGLIITDTLRLEDGKVLLRANATIVINNNDTLGIQSANGKLVSPNYEWGIVQWNIGEATIGNRYTVPFVNDSLEDVAMRFEITDPGVGTGGYVEFTTFGTAALDSPNNLVHHPDLTYYPEAAKTVDSNWSLIADRMWRTVAFGYEDKPDADLTFQYADQDAGGSNNVNLSDLMLSKLNHNRWEQVPHAVIDTDFNLITIDTASAYHLWMLHDTILQNTNTGFSCAEAILIYDTVSFYPTVMTGPFAWFKFTATDTMMRLYVYQGDPAQPFEVDTVLLLGGSCGGGFTSLAHVDTLTSETEVMKEMYLEFDELETDSTYYLKLRQGEEKTSAPVIAFRRGSSGLFSGADFTWSGRDECGKRILDGSGNVVLSVGEIIFANCTPCHRPESGLKKQNGNPIYDFTTYSNCVPRANAIADVIGDYYSPGDHHFMPFWKPVYEDVFPTPPVLYPHFINERVLSEDEIDAIIDWAGNLTTPTPLGYPPFPILPPYQNATQLTGSNVLVLDMETFSYTPATSSSDDYQNFVFVNTLSYPIYIKRVEFSTDGTPVHHILLCRDDTDPSHTLQLQNASNTGISEKGYDISEVTGGGASGGQISTKAFTVMGTWAPGGGGNVLSFPCDFGIKLVEDQAIVVQMHYPQGTSYQDKSEIRLEYQTAATRDIYSIWIGPNDPDYETDLDIPNNSYKDVTFEEPVANLASNINDLYVSGGGSPLFAPIPGMVSILGVLPHMHVRGVKFNMYVKDKSSNRTGLINILDYDFHWQEMYMLKKPLVFPTTSSGSPVPTPDYSFFIDARFDNRCSRPYDSHVQYTTGTCTTGVACSTGYDGTTEVSCNCCVKQGNSTRDEMCVALVMWSPWLAGDDVLILDPEEPGYVQANAAIDKYLCVGESYSLGDPNAVSGPTYSWNPTTDLNNTSIANPTCTMTSASPTSYVLTANKNGCSAKDTVWVRGSCTPSVISVVGNPSPVTLNYTDINIFQIYSAIGGTSNTIDLSKFGYDKIVKISGTLTIDGDYTIKNCKNTSTGFGDAGGFRFGPDGNIKIPAGKTLTIDNSYLSACEGEMWDGIEVLPGGTLNIINNSLIADAEVAVTAAGNINLLNSKFYRNLQGVVVSSTQNYRGTIDCCEFKYDNNQPLMNFMLGACGKRPLAGVSAGNIRGISWNIGNYPTGFGTNTFDGLNCGINANRSNVRVNQNIFKNIQNYSGNSRLVLPVVGKAIYSSGLGDFFGSLHVETNSLATDAAFNNNINDIYAVKCNTLSVRNNKMENNTWGVLAGHCNRTEIDNNYIDNTRYGITLERVNIARSLAGSNPIRTRVTRNAIYASIISTTNYAKYSDAYGIKQTENTAVPGPISFIHDNELYNGNGIYVENCYGNIISQNLISTPNLSFHSRTGIFAKNSLALKIEDHNEFDGGIDVGLDFVSSYGNICNNDFINVYEYAMQFQGDCNKGVGTKLTGNTIGACKYGIYLENGGEIGEQGRNGGEIHGNNFNGPFDNPGNGTPGATPYMTYSFGSAGSLSAFFVTNGGDAPFPNGANNPGQQIITSATGETDPWACGGGVMKNSTLEEKDTTRKEGANMPVNILIIPNPASSTIELIITNTDETFSLEIYDMMAQRKAHHIIAVKRSINIAGLEQGVYMLKFISTKGKQFSSRLVVLR